MQGRGRCGANGRCERRPLSETMISSPGSTDADIGRADDVERHRLGGEDVGIAEPAHHQRPDAERIAAGDHPLAGQAEQRIGALDLLQRIDEAVEQGAVGRGRDEVDDDLGVAGRLEDRAAPVEVAAQPHRVGDIAVMGDREAARGELGEQRLDVAQRGLAGGRIADMADRGIAGERGGSPRPCRNCRRHGPSPGGEWKTRPSQLVMPAASWPRCWSACRPSATIAEALSAPQMPKTPHSSRSLSSSNGLVVSI